MDWGGLGALPRYDDVIEKNEMKGNGTVTRIHSSLALCLKIGTVWGIVELHVYCLPVTIRGYGV